MEQISLIFKTLKERVLVSYLSYVLESQPTVWNCKIFLGKRDFS